MFPCEMARYIAGISPEARKSGQFWPARAGKPAAFRPAGQSYLPLSRRDWRFDRPKMPCCRPKITVVMQQRPAVFETPGSDQQVDGLADGDAALAQGSKADPANLQRLHVHHTRYRFDRSRDLRRDFEPARKFYHDLGIEVEYQHQLYVAIGSSRRWGNLF